MSKTPVHQAAALGEKTPPRPSPSPRRVSTGLSPRRMSSGNLVPVERQLWPNHPKNKHFGSVNSGVDTNGVNIPATNDGDTNSTVDVKDIVELVNTEETGPPELPTATPTKPSPAHTIYRGAGPHGIPLDGHAWKHHPSHNPHLRLHGCGFPMNHGVVNELDSTEAFLLADEEKKIEEKIDTRTPNTTIFTFNKEDHTLANLLRDKLLKNSHVTFAAYRIPHPLFAKFELRVQTDGEITPKEAVLASSRDLVQDLNVLKTNFTREYELRKMVGGAQNGQ